MRKFVAKSSAGLRIRSHPTLQSEQIGMVKPGGIVSFVDKVQVFFYSHHGLMSVLEDRQLNM